MNGKKAKALRKLAAENASVREFRNHYLQRG